MYDSLLKASNILPSRDQEIKRNVTHCKHICLELSKLANGKSGPASIVAPH